MKALHSKTEWPKLAVFDIEATEWVNVTCLCHIDEYGVRKNFDTVAAYLDWVFTVGFRGDIIFAHGGGIYDDRFIIDEVHKRGWQWHAITSGNLIVVLEVTDKRGRQIKFCDSLRLMPDSLAKIGKTVKLEKLDVDRSKIGSYTREDIITYCYRDCEILLLGLQEMRRILSNEGCDFSFTLASIASRHVRRSPVLQWRKFGSDKKPAIKAEYAMADQFCLPAYFGGRVEVYRKGTFRDLYYYDVTSSYPWSMLHPLPAYFAGVHAPHNDVETALSEYGISEVTVHMPDDPDLFYAPILPTRNAKRTKVEYRILQGVRGRWTNVELLELWRLGRDRGLKIDIHFQMRFNERAFMKPFVENFYKLRQSAIVEGDEFKMYAFKILLNSVYGKLIESTDKRSVISGKQLVSEAIEKHGPSALRMTPIEGVYIMSTVDEGAFRHVAAGAYVTARSRVKLWHGVQKARELGAKVYYCDTDSLIVDKPVFGTSNEKVLGEWHYEGRIAEAEILASKVYRLVSGDTGKVSYKAKGIPIRDNDFMTAQQCWEAFTAPAYSRESEKPTKSGLGGFMTDIKRGQLSPAAQMLARQMLSTDEKRIHMAGDSIPYTQVGEP